MIEIFFMILGIISVCIGLYIFKYKKFNIAYMLFYAKSIEKYPEKKLVKNKDEIAQFIGRVYTILGISTFLMGLIFKIFSISETYIIIPLLIIALCNLYSYFHINKIIKK
ncbi:MAG: hypothetical protein IJO26_05420 [Clostridium sp.]|nr:hypothetical protein [Clostridium sp.]